MDGLKMTSSVDTWSGATQITFYGRSEYFILESSVYHNQPTNSIKTTRSVLDTKVCSPDPYIYRYLLKKIEEIAEHLQANAPLSKRVFNYVINQLPEGVPSVSQAARKFNMSPSTLKKHLNQEDANFTEICDAVRKNIAIKMISVQQKPLKEIGNHLGFSNSSTFNRAFKRWTNMSPTEYRLKVNIQEKRKSDHNKQVEEAWTKERVFSKKKPKTVILPWAFL